MRTPGEEAYNAYCEAIRGTGPSAPDTFLPFHKLPERMKRGWDGAGKRMLDLAFAFNNEKEDHDE